MGALIVRAATALGADHEYRRIFGVEPLFMAPAAPLTLGCDLLARPLAARTRIERTDLSQVVFRWRVAGGFAAIHPGYRL